MLINTHAQQAYRLTLTHTLSNLLLYTYLQTHYTGGARRRWHPRADVASSPVCRSSRATVSQQSSYAAKSARGFGRLLFRTLVGQSIKIFPVHQSAGLHSGLRFPIMFALLCLLWLCLRFAFCVLHLFLGLCCLCLCSCLRFNFAVFFFFPFAFYAN